MKEAMFYEKLSEELVQCNLCPHNCKIKDQKRGLCGVRENQKGKLISIVYGKACATAVDPIEKKPLFHFLPGTMSYSVATVGCNLTCKFCQNWEISQGNKPNKPIYGHDLTPKDIVDDAQKNKCESIAYTYTEPTIFYEYAYDTCVLAKKKGIKNIFVSNGFINPGPIDKISKVLDGINIDLKGFSEEYYEKICGARLQPILDAIKQYHKNRVWVEVTTLIVPGHNDNEEMLNKIAEFIAKIDKSIPWHISRFYPHYKMQDTPPTDIKIIHKAVEIGKKHGLKYIYAGNVPGDDYESTYCPKCNKKVIERFGFAVQNINIKDNKCKFCDESINLII